MNTARRRHDAFKVSSKRKAIIGNDDKHNFFKQKVRWGCPGPDCEEERDRDKKIRKLRKKARQIIRAGAELSKKELHSLENSLD